MIVGIGCDLVSHALIKKQKWHSNIEVSSRIFTKNEFELFKSLERNKGVQFLAGRFAAKEAILKCLGTGMLDGISLHDIEILQSKKGRPVAVMKGKVKKIAGKIGVRNWQVSVSHCRGYSLAFALAQKT